MVDTKCADNRYQRNKRASRVKNEVDNFGLLGFVRNCTETVTIQVNRGNVVEYYTCCLNTIG